MNEWLEDADGNRCSTGYFGSREAAQKALDSLENCKNCTNCSGCSDCSGCSGCSDCSGCSRCSRCSDCSRCSGVAFQYDVDNMVAQKAPASGDTGFRVPAVPKIENIHQRVFAAVSQPNALEMGSWHTCDTTHCRAGWVVHLAGDEGRELEKFFNTELAAMKIYEASGYQISPVRFYDSNEAALEDMRRLAAGEVA